MDIFSPYQLMHQFVGPGVDFGRENIGPRNTEKAHSADERKTISDVQ